MRKRRLYLGEEDELTVEVTAAHATIVISR